MQLKTLGRERILESAGYGPGGSDPDITVLSDGRLVVTWTETVGRPTDAFDDDGRDVYARILDSDGRPLGDVFQVNPFTAQAQDRPHVVALGQGTFAIGWTQTLTFGDHPTDRDVFVRFFDADGAPFDNFLIDYARDTVPGASSQVLRDIVALEGGNFAVLVETGGFFASTTEARLYDDTGRFRGKIDGPIEDIAVLADGNIVVAGAAPAFGGRHVSGEHVELRLFDATFDAPDGIVGVYDPVTFYVDGTADPDVVNGLRSKVDGSVKLAALAGGGFAVAFAEDIRTLDDTEVASQIVVKILSEELRVEFTRVFDAETFDASIAGGREFDMISLEGGGVALAMTKPGANPLTLDTEIVLLDEDGGIATRLEASARSVGNQGQPSLTQLDDGTVALAFVDDSGLGAGGSYNPMRLATFEITGPTGRFVGTTGDDRLAGLAGHDRISGLEGNDEIRGRGGNDRLQGDEGNDKLFGGAGGDGLRGGEGRDVIRGQSGADGIGGGAGDDRLFGNAGRDVLGGGRGKDRLDGGAGDDILKGGANDDLLTGGRGNDTFLFTRGQSGDDTIFNFNADEDIIQIELLGARPNSVQVVNEILGTVISFGDASVTLNGVQLIESEITFLFT